MGQPSSFSSGKKEVSDVVQKLTTNAGIGSQGVRE